MIGKVLIVLENKLADFMSGVTGVVWEPLDDLGGEWHNFRIWPFGG